MNKYCKHEYEGFSASDQTEFDRIGIFKGIAAYQRKEDRQINRARILEDHQIERVLRHISDTSNSRASDEVKFLFSVYAGLRVAEIAGLTLDAVVDADDRISRHIIVGRHIAKWGRQRVIPILSYS